LTNSFLFFSFAAFPISPCRFYDSFSVSSKTFSAGLLMAWQTIMKTAQEYFSS